MGLAQREYTRAKNPGSGLSCDEVNFEKNALAGICPSPIDQDSVDDLVLEGFGD
ncbi:MAG: hypothetical protein HC851_22395 [Acaryochloris sp. RU_4_1]|nr:hypothetical protein [Acaryochloris sp. RU_4_1]NJR57016.1 hypothetical protein [Acaryochloris sp. CRU_2_0]